MALLPALQSQRLAALCEFEAIWSTEQVSVQAPMLHREFLSQKEKKMWGGEEVNENDSFAKEILVNVSGFIFPSCIQKLYKLSGALI